MILVGQRLLNSPKKAQKIAVHYHKDIAKANNVVKKSEARQSVIWLM